MRKWVPPPEWLFLICAVVISPNVSNAQCIDTSLIDSTAPCTSIFDPVCGCDGITYSNSCVGEKLAGITSWISGPCSSSPGCFADAGFSYSATGLNVNFTDTSIATSSIAAWDWTFGDGGTSTLANPSHTYSAAGSYTVCLDITVYYFDSSGRDDTCYDTRCDTILVDTGSSGIVCNADFSYAFVGGYDYDFTDASTATGTIVTWSWDFGDGGSSPSASPSHTFPGPGMDTVCLTITTDDSCTDMFCQILDVRDTGSTTGKDLMVSVTDIEISPVPATESVNIKFSLQNAGTVSWTLLSLDGRSVKLQTPQHFGSGPAKVCVEDLNELAPGMYILNLVKDQRSTPIKLIVSR